MSKFAIAFPGQGSQSVGMLAELAETYPIIKETFAEASAVLGYDFVITSYSIHYTKLYDCMSQNFFPMSWQCWGTCLRQNFLLVGNGAGACLRPQDPVYWFKYPTESASKRRADDPCCPTL